MNPDQISTIAYTIDTIEKNMEHPINLDEIAKEVGISKYHLLRLFKAISDKSVMSYVRGRRLSLSLKDLLNSDMNIIDIALKYHFDYEQSYIRAFQNQFHITPARYRKLRPELPIEQQLDIRTLKNVGQGFVIQPRMVMKPAFHVQGIQKEIFHEENLFHKTTNELALLFHEHYFPLVPNKVNEHIYLAMIFYSKNRFISNYYMPCVETSIPNKPEPPFQVFSVPLQEYAVFRYIGLHAPTEVTYKTLKELYGYSHMYIDSTKCYQIQPYHFEQMDLTICSSTYCEMDLYYPINSQTAFST